LLAVLTIGFAMLVKAALATTVTAGSIGFPRRMNPLKAVGRLSLPVPVADEPLP
jgi:hypothetical protein